MSLQAWTYLIVGATFALYIGIAWGARVKDTRGFYVAGGGVPPWPTAWPRPRTG